MERKADTTEPRSGDSRVVIEETERRPGQPPAEPERAGAPHDEPHVEVEPTEARQGEKRLMVRRTLLISLTLAVLAMIILWFVFT